MNRAQRVVLTATLWWLAYLVFNKARWDPHGTNGIGYLGLAGSALLGLGLFVVVGFKRRS